MTRANWDLAYRYEDQLKAEVTYTVPIISKGAEEFSNLVIVQKGGKVNSYIMNYIPDKEWIKNKPRRRGFGTFTGTLQLLNLEGEVFAKSVFEKGKAVKSSKSNSRLTECETFFDVEYTEVCAGDTCHISEMKWTEYEVCDDEDQGGGDFLPGDTTPNDGFGGGGGPTNPGDLGNPGVLDPEDIGYWLRPLNAGDDINNPYDGMKAIATDDTIYTYDAQINGWLMPEVTVLEEQGFIPNFFNLPDFDGGIISSLVLTGVVRAGERTPIGQVIVSGVLFHLWLYSIYEMSTRAEEKLETVAHCTRLYELCIGKYGYKNMDCGVCQNFCNTNGYWDARCPLNDR